MIPGVERQPLKKLKSDEDQLLKLMASSSHTVPILTHQCGPLRTTMRLSYGYRCGLIAQLCAGPSPGPCLGLPPPTDISKNKSQNAISSEGGAGLAARAAGVIVFRLWSLTSAKFTPVGVG